ncbi:MAG: hypothetical protein LBQ68_01160, partial [Clostridiales bacterium]|nr:hypothetical protein [Clostridiales bacterium]
YSRIIEAFILCSILLVVSIWQLIKKRATYIININGWKYQLFLKKKVYLCILLYGCSKILFVACVLSILYFVDFLPKPKDMTIGALLVLILFIIFTIPILGYTEYKKYESMKFNE